MFSKVYTHRDSESIAIMIADAIINAKDLFNIPDCLFKENLDDFIKLTDDYIIYKIKYNNDEK